MSVTPTYQHAGISLLQGDAIELMNSIDANVFDMVFADPPYFLSNGGISCSGGKQVLVNKGTWDEGRALEEKHRFNRDWIRACKRVMKKSATIWISGTFHNIYSVGFALEQEGFRILNNVTWEKTNPPPNLGCRCFTHSTETILWAKKDDRKAKHYFNYQLMKSLNGGKQMKDVWTGSLTKQSEKTEGKHPTQKPEYLLERIILAATPEGAFILDPFVGSGTTAVVAKKLNRKCLGIDSSSEYLDIACKRLERIDHG